MLSVGTRLILPQIFRCCSTFTSILDESSGLKSGGRRLQKVSSGEIQNDSIDSKSARLGRDSVPSAHTETSSSLHINTGGRTARENQGDYSDNPFLSEGEGFRDSGQRGGVQPDFRKASYRSNWERDFRGASKRGTNQQNPTNLSDNYMDGDRFRESLRDDSSNTATDNFRDESMEGFSDAFNDFPDDDLMDDSVVARIGRRSEREYKKRGGSSRFRAEYHGDYTGDDLDDRGRQSGWYEHGRSRHDLDTREELAREVKRRSKLGGRKSRSQRYNPESSDSRHPTTEFRDGSDYDTDARVDEFHSEGRGYTPGRRTDKSDFGHIRGGGRGYMPGRRPDSEFSHARDERGDYISGRPGKSNSRHGIPGRRRDKSDSKYDSPGRYNDEFDRTDRESRFPERDFTYGDRLVGGGRGSSRAADRALVRPDPDFPIDEASSSAGDGGGNSRLLTEYTRQLTGLNKRQRKKLLVGDITDADAGARGDADMLSGPHVVGLALRSPYRQVRRVFFQRNASPRVRALLETCEELGVPAEPRTVIEMDALSRGTGVHQGVCALADPLQVHDIDQLLAPLQEQVSVPPPPRTWVMIDRVQDPMNLGSMLRTCYFMGVDNVLLSAINSCRLSSTVSRASAGVLEIFPIHSIAEERYEEVFDRLRQLNWRLLASTCTRETDSTQQTATEAPSTNSPRNTLLVVGNEGKGIDPFLLERCTPICVDPGRQLPNGVDSLNVAVATGILLSRLRTQ